MKKLFLSMAILFAMGTVFTACGDDASGDSTEATDGGEGEGEGEGEGGGEGEGESGDKTICECLQMKNDNPELTGPPEGSGCEWMNSITEEEGAALMQQAKKDCPELLEQ